jgi:hypothetical protein
LASNSVRENTAIDSLLTREGSEADFSWSRVYNLIHRLLLLIFIVLMLKCCK